ncbi:hypothetical protein [Nostoc sp.]|nr:hypothetical protein [Nostoc sp.]
MTQNNNPPTTAIRATRDDFTTRCLSTIQLPKAELISYGKLKAS